MVSNGENLGLCTELGLGKVRLVGRERLGGRVRELERGRGSKDGPVVPPDRMLLIVSGLSCSLQEDRVMFKDNRG